MNLEGCKEIQGLGGNYFISPLGYIYSIPREWRGKRKNPGMKIYGNPNSLGYMHTTLTYNKKRMSVKIHRLVGTYFVNNPLCLKEINHIDGDKTNNKATNLEWCTRSHNLKHAYALGLRISNKGKKYKSKL